MDRLAPDRTESAVNDVINAMPSWVRHDLASDQIELRQRAQDTLAARIVDRLIDTPSQADEAQIALPIR